MPSVIQSMKYIWLCFTFLLLLLLSSCSDEIERNKIESQHTNVSLHLKLKSATIVQTRSGHDDAYVDPSSIYLLVFDGDSDNAKLTDWSNSTYIDQSENGTFYFASKLQETSEQRYIYIIANASIILSEWIHSGGWAPNVTTLGQVRHGLKKHPLPQFAGIIYQQPQLHPMISEQPVSISSIGSNVRIGTVDDAIELTRNTAKVTVHNQTNDPSFSIEGANLLFVPESGYIFPGMVSDLSTTPIARHHYGGGNDSGADLEHTIASRSGNDITPLYCYESMAATCDNTALIIKVTYRGITGFHRVNLVDNVEKKQLDLKRNHHYQVRILKIQSPGYRTAIEALAGEAISNDIDYEIYIQDPDSHEIVTNGKEYMGLSNSKLIVYKDGAVDDILATTLTYSTNSYWSNGTIVLPAGVSLSRGTTTLPATAGTDTIIKRDLYISLNNTFRSGKITFRFGNLAQTLTIEKSDKNVSAFSTPIVLSKAVVGNTSTNTAWLKLSDSFDSYNAQNNQSIISENGDVYMHFDSNIGFEDQVQNRQAELFVAYGDDKGRAKVIVTQEKFDIYNNPVPIEPFTYVGTFHRADETGERIIRIAANPKYIGPNYQWTATVVHGDFIRLSSKPSDDPGISNHPYGRGDQPAWTTKDAIEANCNQYIKNPADWSTSIQGTATEVSGSNMGSVYFRISLTSKLPGGATAAPRYGLVALSHASGTHFIYVRQGEAEDYLMRPEDPVHKEYSPSGSLIYDGWVSGNRPLAAQFSPFNLTDPGMAMGRVRKTARSYGFVKYPSQGGYYFLQSTLDAYHPASSTGNAGGYPASATAPYRPDLLESCPPGYRRPRDGSDDIYRTSSYNNTGDATTPKAEISEIRQSLWLYPRNYGATQTNNKSNFRYGYYADGYFDRHEIKKPTVGNKNEDNSAVWANIDGSSDAYYNIAFAGTLLFNPYNHASLFIPKPGIYFNRNFATTSPLQIEGAGNVGVITTSTLCNGANFWSAWFGLVNVHDVADNYVNSNDVAVSIRCVKD